MTLQFSTLLNALPGNLAQGTIWGIMALGLYVSFRLLDFSDLTVDGSFATGGAVAVTLIVSGCPTWLAMAAALIAGMLAGLVTGLLHTRLGIAPILAGILTQIALYSINLHILGNKANLAVSVDKFDLLLSLRNASGAILTALVFAAVLIALFYWFFGTELGSSIRSTGANPQMSKAQGINIQFTKVFALALSNGIVALSGALMAQYQGFADVQMGRGAIVIGLAAVIIGEVIRKMFFRKQKNFALQLAFVVIGGILYYAIVGIVLWLRLPTNDLKLFTAIIVALFLAIPHLKKKQSERASQRRSRKESEA